MASGDAEVRSRLQVLTLFIHFGYSLRKSQSRRATAHRDGDFIRLLTIAPDHDATDGKK